MNIQTEGDPNGAIPIRLSHVSGSIRSGDPVPTVLDHHEDAPSIHEDDSKDPPNHPRLDSGREPEHRFSLCRGGFMAYNEDPNKGDEMKIQMEEMLKWSEDLAKLDQILVGGLLCVIAEVRTNAYGHKVLRCGIVGAKTKKRNQLTVIVPDQTPIITYF